MVSGAALLLIIFGAVIFMVFSASVLKLHPFLALLLATLFTGFAVGMPLKQILDTINQGFGTLLGSIGMVVVLGSAIGVALEKSGAALQIANVVVGVVGKQRPAIAMGIIGAIVGIPVFCDSGFIILSGLAKALAKKTGKKFSVLALSLAGGLYTTHVLVPPTPGPLACAGNLGLSDHLGSVILIGLLVSIPSTAIAIFYGKYIWTAFDVQTPEIPDNQKITEEWEDVLPPIFLSLLPIFLPVLLIALASFVNILTVSEGIKTSISFLGSPLIALSLGLFCSFFLFSKWDKKLLTNLVGDGIAQAGPILVLTGAGGSFGALLKATPIADIVKNWIGTGIDGIWVLVIGYLIATLLKTAQGSSTSALIITSSILAPLLGTMGLDTPVEISLLVMSIGGGAMTVSHANDSYFWVVAQFGNFQLKEGYQGLTLMTLLQGISILLTTMLLYFLIV
jgi:gluconate:H+ symporter, GntP family